MADAHNRIWNRSANHWTATYCIKATSLKIGQCFQITETTKKETVMAWFQVISWSLDVWTEEQPRRTLFKIAELRAEKLEVRLFILLLYQFISLYASLSQILCTLPECGMTVPKRTVTLSTYAKLLCPTQTYSDLRNKRYLLKHDKEMC